MIDLGTSLQRKDSEPESRACSELQTFSAFCFGRGISASQGSVSVVCDLVLGKVRARVRLEMGARWSARLATATSVSTERGDQSSTVSRLAADERYGEA
jgi:hypothetical protein